MFKTSDYIDNIFAISREGADLGFDLGFAWDIFMNAVRHGGVPDGEASEVRALMDKVCTGLDWETMKADYLSMTEDEADADYADYLEVEKARLGNV